MCVASGMNASPISSGVVAVVTVALSATSSSTVPLTVAGAAALPDGSALAVSGTGGTIALQAVPPTVSALQCAPASVASGATSTCTVTLSVAAPAGGSVVTVSSNNAALTTPASVTVAAGATTANFTATAGSVTANQSVTVTATLSGSSKTTTVTVTPPAVPTVSALQCAPASVASGATSTCTVTLSLAAPSGGSVVTVSSNNAALTTPASVTVAAGATTATFTATAGSVTANQSVTVTATVNGSSATFILTVTVAAAAPPVITSRATAGGTVGTPFSYQITATNSPSSYAATGLPAGLALNSTTGLISGTPSAAATSTVSLTATNSNGTGTATLAITITATHFVQTTAAAASGTASSFARSFSHNTLGGDLILVGFDFDNSVTPVSVTDSQGNTYTQVGPQLKSPSSSISTRVYYAQNIKGGSDKVTITLSGNSSFIEVYFAEYSGVDPINPIDAQAAAAGNAGSVSSGNATTTVAGDVIYAFCIGDSACSVGSGFAARSTFNANLLEDKTAGSPGAYAATGTSDSGWTMHMVALKPASAPVNAQSAVMTAAAVGTAPTSATPAPRISSSSIDGRKTAGPALPSNSVRTLSCAPRSVSAGASATCELRLTSGDVAQVQLASNSSQVRIPAGVTNRPNQSSLTFQVSVEAIAKQQSAIVSATLANSQVQDTIQVMPAAGPILTVPDKQNAKFGAPVGFTVGAADPGDLPVQLAVRNVPAGASFDAESGRFDWVPSSSQAGRYVITFTASNAAGQTSTAQTTIEVDSGKPVLTPSPTFACSPDSIASLDGQWLAAGPTVSDPSGNSTELAGAKVNVNGQYVPLLSASPTQVRFLCPAMDPATQLQVVVETASAVTEPLTTVMQSASPWIFSLDASGQNQGMVSLAGTTELAMSRNPQVPAKPAQPGDDIRIWATGLGSSAWVSTSTVSVNLAGVDASVESVNAVPGLAGVYTIQVRVPLPTTFGDAMPLEVQVATPDGKQFKSNRVTVAVEPVRQ